MATYGGFQPPKVWVSQTREVPVGKSIRSFTVIGGVAPRSWGKLALDNRAGLQANGLFFLCCRTTQSSDRETEPTTQAQDISWFITVSNRMKAFILGK